MNILYHSNQSITAEEKKNAVLSKRSQTLPAGHLQKSVQCFQLGEKNVSVYTHPLSSGRFCLAKNVVRSVCARAHSFIFTRYK